MTASSERLTRTCRSRVDRCSVQTDCCRSARSPYDRVWTPCRHARTRRSRRLASAMKRVSRWDWRRCDPAHRRGSASRDQSACETPCDAASTRRFPPSCLERRTNRLCVKFCCTLYRTPAGGADGILLDGLAMSQRRNKLITMQWTVTILSPFASSQHATKTAVATTYKLRLC